MYAYKVGCGKEMQHCGMIIYYSLVIQLKVRW